MFTWEFDAPTGTYKSHAMSKHLYDVAIEEAVFMDHVDPVSGYGKGKGETVTLTRLADIDEPTSGALQESQRIPEDSFALSTTSITVSEFGRSLPYTSLSMDLSEFNLESPIQQALKDQMKLVLDTAAATAFRATKLKYCPTGVASSEVVTDGTFDSTASANMNVYHCEEIRDLMYDTYRVPMVGDSYIAIFRTLGLRGIKRDPEWEEWHGNQVLTRATFR